MGIGAVRKHRCDLALQGARMLESHPLPGRERVAPSGAG